VPIGELLVWPELVDQQGDRIPPMPAALAAGEDQAVELADQVGKDEKAVAGHAREDRERGSGSRIGLGFGKFTRYAHVHELLEANIARATVLE
jgi:hypothetical protein